MIRTLLQRLWPKQQEVIVQNNTPFIYSEEQLMARLKFFIGVCLALTLTGIVFVVLYSLIFVTQPLNAISPIDQKFFELIVPIATFLTGTLSGIMLAGGTKEETEAKMALMKQASDNQEKVSKAAAAERAADRAAAAPSFATFVPANGAPNGTQAVIVGFGGKLAPPPAHQPEI